MMLRKVFVAGLLGGLTMLIPSGSSGPAQGQIRDYPLFEIAVHQVAGQVRIEFYREEGEGRIKRKVPVKVFTLTVYLPGEIETLWKIVSPDGRGETSNITYG